MTKFEDMNLNLNSSIKIIKVNGVNVAVKQYLPAEDKNSILENAIQKADQGTILNTYLLDCIFNMYVIFKYTDIEFSTEQKEDLFSLYDILESNNIVNIIISAIPEKEYNELKTNLINMVEDYLEYRNSARALVQQLAFFAPDAAEKLQQVSENIDIDKVQQIVKIADATGMNNKLG